MQKIYYLSRNLIFKIFPFIERRNHARQFIKFCIVGVSNLAIDFTSYFLLTRFFHFYFIVANISSFLLAVSWSFYWNKKWTFNHELKKLNAQYLKFIVTNLIGIVVQTTILYILVTSLQWDDIVAKLLAVFIVSFWNFAATKFWAFK